MKVKENKTVKQGFMSGRNGADDLYRFILVCQLIFMVVSAVAMIFIDELWFIIVIVTVLAGTTGYLVFRLLSKNLKKRREENNKYLKAVNAFKRKRKLAKNKRRDRKTHVYRKCPTCKSVLRLPKRKGKHIVCCPKCSKRFEVSIH